MRSIAKVIREEGSERIVYVDESGFDNRGSSSYGWTKRGKKLYREVTGKRAVRQNLIAGHCRGKLLAPMLTTGSINAQCFEQWLGWLIKELEPCSTIIMDNAPIHRKSVMQRLVKAAAHRVIFLPKYSPDFNKIEHDFAALKKRHAYSPENTTLDSIIHDYANR